MMSGTTVRRTTRGTGVDSRVARDVRRAIAFLLMAAERGQQINAQVRRRRRRCDGEI